MIVYVVIGLVVGWVIGTCTRVSSSEARGHSAKGPGKNKAPESESGKPPTPPPNLTSSIIDKTSQKQKCPQCGHFHDEPLQCFRSMDSVYLKVEEVSE